MADEDSFEDVAAIAREVEAIGDLDSIRRSVPCPTGVVAPSIPTHQFRLTMRVEPGGERIGGPLGQQINHAMSFQIRENRAVVMAPPQGEIINAEHGRRADRRFGKGAHEAEQRHTTDTAAAPTGEAHAGTSAEGEAEVREEGLQGHTSSRIAGSEAGHLLGEGATRAGGGAAAEAPDREVEEHAPTADGLIGNMADVARVDMAGTAMTGRTAGGRSQRFEIEFERCCGKRGMAHTQTGEMRQQGYPAHRDPPPSVKRA